MNRRLLTAFSASLLLIATLLPSGVAAASPGKSAPFTADGIYIVQLIERPAVAYAGGIPGLAATKPAKGAKIDPSANAVVRYTKHLKGRHDAELAAVGGRGKLYSYSFTFNGFAANLTAAQANKLAADKNVLSVSPSETFEVDTSSTPDFLGLTAPGGLWAQLGGTGRAGEDVIIGVVDSGIWPESLSFTDRVSNRGVPSEKGRQTYKPVKGWRGTCQTGEQFTKKNCNQKLIGARYYNASQGGDAGINADRPWEFTSPRDYNGHGTHTTSTAGGNFGVPTTGPSSVFGSISGMAPRARVAMYKALWSTEDASTASGSTPDLVAAIDQAVADGVDVINYSISGSTTNFADPVEISFLFAADAGVFVAASAGNSGPASSTVAHPSPWITTVAAGTHSRDGQGSVTLGNGTTYNGASVATAVGPVPLIDSMAAGVAGADATALALCFTAGDNGGTAVLDPAKVAGKIVVCDRGVNARVNKSLAVKDAGGLGMILANTSANSLNADFHFVPTVHVSHLDRAAIKAYAATTSPAPTATINDSTIVFNAPAPFTAAFSSRGPLLAGGGDLLKPDVIAPGQDILAAVAPPGQQGLSFNLLSGTSMSSPHVAGLAALLRDLHPTWSPMAIKSALMTTGTDVLDGGTPAPSENPVLIFRQGAGHVRPNSAANPGLVYNSGFNDWLAFLCGTTTAVNPASCAALAGAGFSLDASDFNSPSISIGDLAGIQTVTRKVTNVGTAAATYNASVVSQPGIAVEVSPLSLTLTPGQTKSYTVKFTRTTAALGAFVGGQLTWSDGSHTVRSPITIRPVALAAPAQVNGTGGPISYEVKFGYNGPFTASPRGLIPAATVDATVADDPTDDFNTANPTANQGIQVHDVVVPAGSTYARFSLFDEDTDGNDDLDLYTYRVGAGGVLTLVAISGSGTSAEESNFVNPIAATYKVFVHGFAAEGGSANYTFFSWVLGTADAGNMTVTEPAAATIGATGTVSLAFSGLAADTRYLGSVVYGGAAGLPNPTIVRVDTP